MGGHHATPGLSCSPVLTVLGTLLSPQAPLPSPPSLLVSCPPAQRPVELSISWSQQALQAGLGWGGAAAAPGLTQHPCSAGLSRQRRHKAWRGDRERGGGLVGAGRGLWGAGRLGKRTQDQELRPSAREWPPAGSQGALPEGKGGYMLRQGGRWKDPGQSRPSLASASLQWTALGQTRCRTDPRRQGNAVDGNPNCRHPQLRPRLGPGGCGRDISLQPTGTQRNPQPVPGGAAVGGVLTCLPGDKMWG